MDINRAQTAFFIGPRVNKLTGYNSLSYGRLMQYLRHYVYDTYYRRHIRSFVTGGEQGFDQLAFDAVHNNRIYYPEMNINNVLMLPFHGQDARWSDTGIFGRNEYRRMLEKATTIFYSHDGPCDSNPARLMAERNDAMLSMSSHCIGLWPDDDTWRDEYAPIYTADKYTADTLRKAMKVGCSIDIIRYKIDVVATIEKQMIVPLRVDKIA